MPFVVSLVLLQILFGFFPKYTRKFFPKRWDHILGLIFGLALALLILTFSWTLAVAVAPFVTEQEVLARSRGVQLIRVLSAPSRGLLNRLLPSEYQLPDGQEENEEANSEETGTGASRILELEDGTRIALPAPPDGQAVRRATGYGSGVASGLGGSPIASEEVQRIQEALDALLKSSEGAIGKAAPASTKSAIQEEIAPTATSLPTLLSEPAGKSGTDEEFAALRRLNKLLEDHETLQQDNSGNSFVPDLPQFTREDLPAVQVARSRAAYPATASWLGKPTHDSMSGKPWQNKIALIAGASRGLGQALALRLAEGGAQTVLIARTVGGLEDLDDAIVAAGGLRPTLVPLDLTQEKDERGDDPLRNLALALADRHGTLRSSLCHGRDYANDDSDSAD